MFVPLVDGFAIAGKTITADALLTQRHLARYLVEQREAHYLFTVKGNQPILLENLRLFFQDRGEPDFREPITLAHGRIETRAIWTTTALNDYLDFPAVGQAFLIERHTLEKTSGHRSTEIVYGLTSHSPETANAARLLSFNREHWTIENGCHYILDWNGRTKIVARSEPVTARKTSPVCVASPSDSSNQKAATVSLPPSANCNEMSDAFSII